MIFRELEKLLLENGCIRLNTRGSHCFFRSPKTGKKFPVPYHGSHDLKKGTLKKIMKQSGLE